MSEFSLKAIEKIGTEIVGRRNEFEVMVAALAANRHVMLEGPPGTGKSSLLRALAEASNAPLVFVEGNAELTPARLIGSFDPARVLTEGYSAEVFLEGPLTEALQTGGLLYIEEINRIPEETLNVIITAMSERELHIPRLGKISAAKDFRILAAMNPFDAIGTARISAAVYDRVCRVTMGYQSEEDEIAICEKEVGGHSTLCQKAVRVVRDTRNHPDIRIGSSVRGAIDTVLIAEQLADLRNLAVDNDQLGIDAALAALSGRIRVREGVSQTPEDIIRALWQKHSTKETDSGKL